MTKKRLIGLVMFVLPLMASAQQVLDLSGAWQVSIGDEPQTIILPNTLDGAGIGERNTLEPMLQKPQLSRLTRKHSFIGEAVYQRNSAQGHGGQAAGALAGARDVAQPGGCRWP